MLRDIQRPIRQRLIAGIARSRNTKGKLAKTIAQHSRKRPLPMIMKPRYMRWLCAANGFKRARSRLLRTTWTALPKIRSVDMMIAVVAVIRSTNSTWNCVPQYSMRAAPAGLTAARAARAALPCGPPKVARGGLSNTPPHVTNGGIIHS